MIRNYATAAAKRPSRLKGPPLGLDHVGFHFHIRVAFMIKLINLVHTKETSNSPLAGYRKNNSRYGGIPWARHYSWTNSLVAVSDPSTRDEMRQFARREFGKHRNVTDIVSRQECLPVLILTDLRRAISVIWYRSVKRKRPVNGLEFL